MTPAPGEFTGRALADCELAEAGDRDVAPRGELAGDRVKQDVDDARGGWPTGAGVVAVLS
jgi:hypothetical protein